MKKGASSGIKKSVVESELYNLEQICIINFGGKSRAEKCWGWGCGFFRCSYHGNSDIVLLMSRVLARL